MRALTLIALGVALAWSQGIAVPSAAGCDPVGEIRFVCDQAGPEDLVAVPGSAWLVASAYGAEGGLNLIDGHVTCRAVAEAHDLPFTDYGKGSGIPPLRL